jgi:hypothetical protein
MGRRHVNRGPGPPCPPNWNLRIADATENVPWYAILMPPFLWHGPIIGQEKYPDFFCYPPGE